MKHDFLYSVEREYSVPVERLWQAWTNAAELEAWYHPTVLSTLAGSVSSEATDGGLWTTGIDVPDYGFVAYFYGWYSNVQPLVSLEHTMCYTQSAEEFAAKDPNAPHHKVKVEFESRGDGKSWVKFSQFGEMPEEQIQATTDGMSSYFDSLGEFLAR
jgi:uncharacterized protein YndB with AHSA1/START domain